jgi:hypothetical protein
MEPSDAQDPSKSRHASRLVAQARSGNNPFFQSRPDGDSPSPVDLAGPRQQDMRLDQDSSRALPTKRPTTQKHAKPSILSTLLNFGLNTAPYRSSKEEDFVVKDPWKRASVVAETMNGKDAANFAIPLPTIPVPGQKVRRPSAIIRNVTGCIHSSKTLPTAESSS